jgi:hypothetical protein
MRFAPLIGPADPIVTYACISEIANRRRPNRDGSSLKSRFPGKGAPPARYASPQAPIGRLEKSIDKILAAVNIATA